MSGPFLFAEARKQNPKTFQKNVPIDLVTLFNMRYIVGPPSVMLGVSSDEFIAHFHRPVSSVLFVLMLLFL